MKGGGGGGPEGIPESFIIPNYDSSRFYYKLKNDEMHI